MIESILMYRAERDLGMEGTRRSRKSAREIFERSARSASEGRVKEE
jgi:hypothetical protein